MLDNLYPNKELKWSKIGKPLLPNERLLYLTNIYSEYAGTDSGYTFFSPNIPSAIQLIFKFDDCENGNTKITDHFLNSYEGRLRFTSLGRLSLIHI